MATDDIFQLLEISQELSFQEAKKAYRKQIKKAHPDLGGEPINFQKLVQAWAEVEKEPTKFFSTSCPIEQYSIFGFKMKGK